MNVLAVTGIRSDYDILFPVIDELRNSDAKVSIVVSGAHLSDEVGNTLRYIVDDGFEIAEKIDTLLSTSRATQRVKGVALLIQGLSQTIERVNPDFLLVVGDREESIATAIVGNYMDKLLVHIAGGDPVYGNADDPVRFAVSKLAHIHCCFAEQYAENLRNIGEESFRVFWTGNPSYVNIANVDFLSLEQLSNDIGVDITDGRFIVVIKHPLSSEVHNAEKQMDISLKAINIFCKENNFKAILISPNTDPGSHGIRTVMDTYSDSEYLHPVESLPRLQFINLIRNAKVLAGNSSMGILEAPYYKLPVVNIGNRQKGRLNAGNVEFVPYDIDLICLALTKACLDDEYRSYVSGLQNPYGNADAAIKIRKVMESIDLKDRRWFVKEKLC